MNREPKRWLDDENAPAGVHDLLRGSRRAKPIDAGSRARVGKRVARLSMLPVSLVTFIGAKSALAAFGAAAGIATFGMAAVVVMTHEKPKAPDAAPAAPAKRAPKHHAAPPVVAPPAAPEVPAPSIAPAPEPPKNAPAPGVAAPPASASGLAEETEFLDRARRTVKTDPEFAVLLVREHGTRFPRGKLGAERNLIEIEALYRSGRHAEARALAERQLASGAGALYAERVRALLARIDEGR